MRPSRGNINSTKHDNTQYTWSWHAHTSLNEPRQKGHSAFTSMRSEQDTSPIYFKALRLTWCRRISHVSVGSELPYVCHRQLYREAGYWHCSILKHAIEEQMHLYRSTIEVDASGATRRILRENKVPLASLTASILFCGSCAQYTRTEVCM